MARRYPVQLGEQLFGNLTRFLQQRGTEQRARTERRTVREEMAERYEQQREDRRQKQLADIMMQSQASEVGAQAGIQAADILGMSSKVPGGTTQDTQQLALGAPPMMPQLAAPQMQAVGQLPYDPSTMMPAAPAVGPELLQAYGQVLGEPAVAPPALEPAAAGMPGLDTSHIERFLQQMQAPGMPIETVGPTQPWVAAGRAADVKKAELARALRLDKRDLAGRKMLASAAGGAGAFSEEARIGWDLAKDEPLSGEPREYHTGPIDQAVLDERDAKLERARAVAAIRAANSPPEAADRRYDDMVDAGDVRGAAQALEKVLPGITLDRAQEVAARDIDRKQREKAATRRAKADKAKKVGLDKRIRGLRRELKGTRNRTKRAKIEARLKILEDRSAAIAETAEFRATPTGLAEPPAIGKARLRVAFRAIMGMDTSEQVRALATLQKRGVKLPGDLLLASPANRKRMLQRVLDQIQGD